MKKRESIFQVLQKQPEAWLSTKDIMKEMNLSQSCVDYQIKSFSYWFDFKYQAILGKSGKSRRLVRLKPCFWKKGVKP